MISSLLLESAVRSVFLAIAVWIGLRAFNVRNVLAQKAAWGIVLASALAMPIVLPMAAHWSVLPANVRVVIPADPQNLLEELQARIRAETSPQAASTERAPETAPQSEPSRATLISDSPDESSASASTGADSFDAGTAKYAEETTTAAQVSVSEAEAQRPEAPRRAALPQPAATSERTGLSIWSRVLLVYVSIAGVLLLRLLCGLLVALRVWHRATPVTDDCWAPHAASLDLPSRANIRSSSDVGSPVTICSAIVLPADYQSWDGEKLRVVPAKRARA